MGKVFGPTWKQRVEKEKEGLKELANSKSPIETGGNKKNKAVINLTSSFEDLADKIDAVILEPRELRPRTEVTYSEEPEVDDIQAQLDDILGAEEDDEFSPDPEDEEDEVLGNIGTIRQGELSALLKESSTILNDSEEPVTDTILSGDIDMAVEMLSNSDHVEDMNAAVRNEAVEIDMETINEADSAEIHASEIIETEDIETEVCPEVDDDKPQETLNLYKDLYPQMIKEGTLFIIPSKRPIYVNPLKNDCSLCGLKKSKNNWCRHLVTAGLKMEPPIVVASKRDGTKSLADLMKHQKGTKTKTGRKAPKSNDYKDDKLMPIPEMGPYKFSKNFEKRKSTKEKSQQPDVLQCIPEKAKKTTKSSSSNLVECDRCGNANITEKNIRRHQRSQACQDQSNKESSDLEISNSTSSPVSKKIKLTPPSSSLLPPARRSTRRNPAS